MCARVGQMWSDSYRERPIFSDSARESGPGGVLLLYISHVIYKDLGCSLGVPSTPDLPARCRVTCRSGLPYRAYRLKGAWKIFYNSHIWPTRGIEVTCRSGLSFRLCALKASLYFFTLSLPARR